MLIACVGPDVHRALEKARELEEAFRQKFDPEGSSIERLTEEGTTLVDEVIERVNTVSLFTPRRCIRVRDLLTNCPKARLPALVKALSTDPENVIVITVETDAPSEGALKAVSTLPKWVRYDFSRLDARALEGWICERAAQLRVQVSDEVIHAVAQAADGNTAQAGILLLQAAAMAQMPPSASTDTARDERSLFDWAEAYLKQDPAWRAAVERIGPDSVIYPFLSQLRAYTRVQSGQDSGVPSFVARKLKGIPAREAEERFARLLEALMLQRQGYLREDELASLF